MAETGSTSWSGIRREELRPEALLRQVAARSCGATASFVGSVRDHHEGRAVRAVTYDAFEPLAAAVLAGIAREAAGRFGARVAIEHRIGRLEAGEASVMIAAAAPHRAPAFDACRWAIEEIKRRAPVWKQEHYADGTSGWLEGRSLAPGP